MKVTMKKFSDLRKTCLEVSQQELEKHNHANPTDDKSTKSISINFVVVKVGAVIKKLNVKLRTLKHTISNFPQQKLKTHKTASSSVAQAEDTLGQVSVKT